MQRYDLTAEMYDARYAEEQTSKYKKALENINLTGDSIVLDVGCGTGLFFSHVTVKSHIVVGLDVSCELLLRAKEQAKTLRNVFVVQADADHLPFRNEFFDVVFSFTVLQNMPKPLMTLSELKRVAKLDGSIVVTGLKKVFSLDAFMDILEAAGLQAVSFVDDEFLKCYVAVSKK